jgi:hypothetical protein
MERTQIAGLAGYVYGNYGACPRRDAADSIGDIDIELTANTVAKDGTRPKVGHHFRRCGECVGRQQDFIPRPEPNCVERKLESGGTRIHCDGIA